MPVSCGDGRIIQDRRKDTVYVFDAVFHPDTIKQALLDMSLKHTICLLAIRNINEKLKINEQNNKSDLQNPILANQSFQYKRIEGTIDDKQLKYPKSIYKVIIIFIFIVQLAISLFLLLIAVDCNYNYILYIICNINYREKMGVIRHQNNVFVKQVQDQW